MKKELFYIGFYDDIYSLKRTCLKNPAGTKKMDFIIHALKSIGYKVNVVSLSIDNNPGFHSYERIIVDDLEEHFILPYFSVKFRGKNRLANISFVHELKKFGYKYFKKDTIIINYHSLPFRNLFYKLKKRIGFRWICQIEEIYFYSTKVQLNKKKLANEINMFKNADSFIFVNKYLAKKYGSEKKFIISNGSYQVFSKSMPKIDINHINVVYTGIIKEERGIFELLDAMRFLPSNYYLYILGFGEPENMKKMFSAINDINSTNKRIFFCGIKQGSDYSEFLSDKNIGVGLIDKNESISFNAFPSKILVYLGHCLHVVSTDCDLIRNSELSDLIHYCNNTPRSIASAIMDIDICSSVNYSERIQKLFDKFCNELSLFLEE